MPNLKLYIVFLRAVNVSGKNVIKMIDLKSILIADGFEDVQTYIQSGNIILSSPKDSDTVQQTVQQLIQTHLQLTVKVFVLNLTQLTSALENIPFSKNLEPNKVFITFLSEQPSRTYVDALAKLDHGNEVFHIIDNVLYYYIPDGAAKAKLSNSYFEKKLNVMATGRNINTVKKMLTLCKIELNDKS